ncbi:MAG: DUF1579 domain-containing protein [Ferruginibacter sp.]
MKRTIITAGIFLATFYCQAQAKPETASTATSTTDGSMDAWKAYMTPGIPHKMLAKSTGTWNEEVTMWMAPGAAPEKSKAVAENKMIMNGLYQESITKGTMMGMPFEGKSIVGYDNAKKVFVSSWIDNMGSGIMHMEGPWDDATKSMNLTGTCADPMSGKIMTVRETFRIVDDNTQMMEMYMPGPDGKEFKTMEIKFTRSK